MWAHQISAPETGCILLANPLGNMGTFQNSVVLLLQHSELSANFLAQQEHLG